MEITELDDLVLTHYPWRGMIWLAVSTSPCTGARQCKGTLGVEQRVQMLLFW